MTGYYELIPRTGNTPENADFCLIMDGEEMAPLINSGERIYVSRRESPGNMEVGVFYCNGQIYCRQYCEDYAGNIHLLCANPACEDKNLCLGKSAWEKCLCLGKVLLKEKPAMPIYI